MGLLDLASQNSVSRGYDLYLDGRVSDCSQLLHNEYEGYVQGSLKTPYYVKINLKNPRKSYCDCPHANGNRICKHMVALYFTLFPDEALDYEECINSFYSEYYDDEYYDEEDDNDYDNEYYNYYNHKSHFKEPLFFNEVLKNYIDDLDINEAKKILYEILEKDKEKTYYAYLKDKYNYYLNKNNKQFAFLNKLQSKINNLLNIYDYNYHDYNQVILSNSEKSKIKELYKINPSFFASFLCSCLSLLLKAR